MAITEKPTWKAWIPTIAIVVNTVAVEVLYPWLAGTRVDVQWFDFISVAITALVNAFKQDDNPIRFWDSTLFGVFAGALLQWLAKSFETLPPVFDFKTFFLVLLPPLLMLGGSFARGFGKGYNSEEGGT